jgi:integral membrane sensor domain MASE1
MHTICGAFWRDARIPVNMSGLKFYTRILAHLRPFHPVPATCDTEGMNSYMIRVNNETKCLMTQNDFNIDTTGRQKVPFAYRIALFILLVCCNVLVAKYVVFSFSIAPGVSFFYTVVALMIVTTLWFGMYGALAAYAGCYIGAGILSGLPPDVSLYWSLADFWQVIIPLIAFRVLKADPSLRSIRDLGILVVFGIIINNIAGALWGSATLALSGSIPWAEVPSVFYGWLIGNLVVCIVLGPLSLYFITPIIREHQLFVREYWS